MSGKDCSPKSLEDYEIQRRLEEVRRASDPQVQEIYNKAVEDLKRILKMRIT